MKNIMKEINHPMGITPKVKAKDGLEEVYIVGAVEKELIEDFNEDGIFWNAFNISEIESPSRLIKMNEKMSIHFDILNKFEILDENEESLQSDEDNGKFYNYYYNNIEEDNNDYYYLKPRRKMDPSIYSGLCFSDLEAAIKAKRLLKIGYEKDADLEIFEEKAVKDPTKYEFFVVRCEVSDDSDLLYINEAFDLSNNYSHIYIVTKLIPRETLNPKNF